MTKHYNKNAKNQTCSRCHTYQPFSSYTKDPNICDECISLAPRGSYGRFKKDKNIDKNLHKFVNCWGSAGLFN